MIQDHRGGAACGVSVSLAPRSFAQAAGGEKRDGHVWRNVKSRASCSAGRRDLLLRMRSEGHGVLLTDKTDQETPKGSFAAEEYGMTRSCRALILEVEAQAIAGPPGCRRIRSRRRLQAAITASARVNPVERRQTRRRRASRQTSEHVPTRGHRDTNKRISQLMSGTLSDRDVYFAVNSSSFPRKRGDADG